MVSEIPAHPHALAFFKVLDPALLLERRQGSWVGDQFAKQESFPGDLGAGQP